MARISRPRQVLRGPRAWWLPPNTNCWVTPCRGKKAVTKGRAPRGVSQDVAPHLAVQNCACEKEFDCIFRLDATGKSSVEMLAILEQRIQNDPERGIQVAAEQQRRITRRRLEKLLLGAQ